jgi:NAD(P)-dependent dehydrogenase (short-subunit alcohol dehydrogenase family)
VDLTEELLMELSGQRVVVLGGTSGIGLAVAQAAAGRGAEVIVGSSRPASVERALGQLPAGVRGIAVDLADEDRVRALFDELGELDHLVYTAGESLSMMPLTEFDLQAAQGFFRLRFFGAVQAVAAAAPRLRAGGSITLTTGTAKDRPGPGWAVVAGVCGAMESLTRALAVELAPLRVNVVSPGIVRSPLWSGMDDTAREEMYRTTGAAMPVGRVGEVEDIAQAYLFLMTQPYATGTVVTVDGGGILV